MATLDDKLLGEKLHNYCSSSSEDEGENKDGSAGREGGERSKLKKVKGPKFVPESELKEKAQSNWPGPAHNTGPKGVIKDWQRYKQLENEKNSEADSERRKIIKRLAMTCRSEDVNEKLESESKSEMASSNTQEQNLDDELEDDLMKDEFFREYIRKKFEEMQGKNLSLPRFGRVIELTNDTFLNEIDNENKNVTIIIHIYDQKIPECRLMNECLEIISRDYLVVKLCKIKSHEISLSEKFRKFGCPALLIYKGGELIGNFVKMGDEFGDEFCSSDVENFLLEQGYLPSNEIPAIIRESAQSKYKSDENNDEDD